MSLCLCRNLLHHLPLHLRRWHQLRAVPFPAVPVRSARRHRPRLRLVHVLRLGRPGTHPHRRLLLHPGSLRPAHPQIHLPQVPAGERNRLLKLEARRLTRTGTKKKFTVLICLLISTRSWSSFFLFVCVFKMDVLMIYLENRKTEELENRIKKKKRSQLCLFCCCGCKNGAELRQTEGLTVKESRL